MHDVEQKSGATFKFRRPRPTSVQKPERPAVQEVTGNSVTAQIFPCPDPGIEGMMAESFVYDPQMEEFWNAPSALSGHTF
jgi:hypothetical protein